MSTAYMDQRVYTHRRCGPVNPAVLSMDFHYCQACTEQDDEGVTFAQWPCDTARELRLKP